MLNPYSDSESIRGLQQRLTKHPRNDSSESARSAVTIHLNFAQKIGYPVKHSGKVLDVGCGVGESVVALCELGYDASGIDVLELWGKDFDQYWVDIEKPQGPHLSRLHLVDTKNYELPFPNAHFDFAFSEQVFEHVFNQEDVLREIARVLKPGAISVHRFPGPNYPFEGHISVPFPPLCRFKPYLALWALAGRRSPRQKGFDWRETLELNIATMQYCNYVTKSELRRVAKSVKVKIEFMEMEEMRLRAPGAGLVSKIRDSMPKPFRGLWIRLLAMIAPRYMVIHGRAE